MQVISLICYLLGVRQERRPFLIALPASVLPNWEKEFAAWAPGLRVVAYKGSADARQEVFYNEVGWVVTCACTSVLRGLYI